MEKYGKERLKELRSILDATFSAKVEEFVSNGLSREESIFKVESDFLSSLTDFSESQTSLPSLPVFDGNGHIPAMHQCSVGSFLRRFGTGNDTRTTLAADLKKLLCICQETGTRRVMVGGSFISSKKLPNDVDIAILVDKDFNQNARDSPNSPHQELLALSKSNDSSLQLFLEQSEVGWWEWFRIFGRSKSGTTGYIGVIEVVL